MAPCARHHANQQSLPIKRVHWQQETRSSMRRCGLQNLRRTRVHQSGHPSRSPAANDPCVPSIVPRGTMSPSSQLPRLRSMAIVGQLPCEKENPWTRPTEPWYMARSTGGMPFHGSQGIWPVIEERAKAPRVPLINDKKSRKPTRSQHLLASKECRGLGRPMGFEPTTTRIRKATLSGLAQ